MEDAVRATRAAVLESVRRRADERDVVLRVLGVVVETADPVVAAWTGRIRAAVLRSASRDLETLRILRLVADAARARA